MAQDAGRPARVFISYCHEDERFKEQLEKQLSVLKRQGVVSLWSDRQVGPGREWENAISRELNDSELIVLLVSSDFVASDYCYDKELARAMERHAAGEARVIPVILRPTDYKETPFSRLQFLPKDGKPVTKHGNEDEAFLEIANGIRTAASELVRTTWNQLDHVVDSTRLHGAGADAAMSTCIAIRDAARHVLIAYRHLADDYKYDEIPELRVLLFFVHPDFNAVSLQMFVRATTAKKRCFSRFTFDSSKQKSMSVVARAWLGKENARLNYDYEYTEDRARYLEQSAEFGFDEEKVGREDFKVASAIAFPFEACHFAAEGSSIPIVICLDSERKDVFPERTVAVIQEVTSSILRDQNRRIQDPFELDSEGSADRRGVIDEC